MIRDRTHAARDKLVDRLPVRGELLRGTLLERTVRHKSGCPKCARGEGHRVFVLTVTYPGGRTRQLSVRRERVPAAWLPASCNWLCHFALPRLSFDGKTYVEPSPPFQPLGVLHLTANAKAERVTLVDLAGQQLLRTLLHAPLDAA